MPVVLRGATAGALLALLLQISQPTPLRTWITTTPGRPLELSATVTSLRPLP